MLSTKFSFSVLEGGVVAHFGPNEPPPVGTGIDADGDGVSFG